MEVSSKSVAHAYVPAEKFENFVDAMEKQGFRISSAQLVPLPDQELTELMENITKKYEQKYGLHVDVDMPIISISKKDRNVEYDHVKLAHRARVLQYFGIFADRFIPFTYDEILNGYSSLYPNDFFPEPLRPFLETRVL